MLQQAEAAATDAVADSLTPAFMRQGAPDVPEPTLQQRQVASTEEEASGDARPAAEAQGDDSEVSEDTGPSEEGAPEEGTSEEASTEEGSEEADDAAIGGAQGGDADPGGAPSRGSSRAVARAPTRALAPPRPARLGVPRLTVPPPPVMSPERIQAIRDQTGISPREHHARLRQHADGLYRQVRRGQIEIVHRTEWIAEQTRQDVLGFAADVQRTGSATEGGVRALFATVRRRITAAATTAREAIANAVIADLATMNRRRQEALDTIHEHLTTESTAIRDAADELGVQYEGLSAQAAAQMRQLPFTATGSFTPVAAPTGSGPAMSTDPSVDTSGVDVAQTAMGLEGQRLADAVASEGEDPMGRYVAWLRSKYTPDQASTKHADLVHGADNKANGLDSPAVRQSMVLELVGLANPAASAVERDEAAEGDQSDDELLTEEEAVERARRDAIDSVDAIRDQMLVGPQGLEAQEADMVDGIRRATREAVQALELQAQAAANGILGSAADWASAWRDALDPIRPLFEGDELLQSDALLPTLERQAEALGTMREQQLQAVTEQSESAVDTARTVESQVGESLRSMHPKAAEQLLPLAEGAERDFTLRSFLWTGEVTEGVRAALASATTHAETTLQEHLSTFGGDVQAGVAGWLAEHIVPRLNTQLGNYKTEHDDAVMAFEGEMRAEGGVYAKVASQATLEIRDPAGQLRGALPARNTEAEVGIAVLSVVSLGATAVVGAAYLYHIDPDENAALLAVTGVKPQGREALSEYFDDTFEPDLSERMGRLNDGERATIQAALDARTDADDALTLEALSDSGFLGFSNEARLAVIGGMSDDALTALRASDGFEQTREDLLSGLNRSQHDIAENYIDHGVAAGFEAQTNANLDRAATRGSEAYVREIAQIESRTSEAMGGTYFAQFASQERSQQFLQDVYRAGAVRASGGELSHTDAATMDPDEARQQYAAYQSESRRGRRYMGDNARRAARATIAHGQGSDEAFVEHAAFWTERADLGQLTQNQEVGVDNSYADRPLEQALQQLERAPPGTVAHLQATQRVQELRDQRERRMGLLAERLDLQPGEDETATDAVAGHLAGIFGERHDADGRNYATTLVQNGRGDLLSGILVASRGGGSTNDDLMRQITAGRTSGEVQRARSQYATATQGPEDALDQFLGIGPNADWAGGEVSGDLAHEIERNLVGDADTPRGQTERALLSVFQQLDDDPGALASLLEGSPTESAAQADRREIVAFLAERSGRSPKDVLGPNGRPTQDVLDAVFAPDGSLRQRDGESDGDLAGQQHRLSFLSSSAELGSRQYREEVDRIEASAMVGVAVLTALLTIALIATGVGIVVAGIITAVVGGMATMGVKYGLRGKGRYGYEEAAVDVAMMAVEAGVAWAGGAAMGQLGKGVVAGRLAAANKALTSGLSRALGKTGGTVAAGVLREGAQGFVTGTVQTAMDPNTWRDGTDSALGRMALGGAKMAAIQGVASGVSDGLGELASGGGKRTVGMLENTLDTARANAARTATRSPLTDALLEGGTEALGGAAGEAVGLAFDYQAGTYDGDLAVGLQRVGQSAARDFATSAARSRLVSAHRARVDGQMRRLASQDAPPSEAQIASLRRAMIASGALGYRDPDGLRATVAEIGASRALLRGLDPQSRTLLAGLPPDVLADLRLRLDQGDLGSDAEQQALLKRVREADPELDPAKLEGVLSRVRTGPPEDAAVDTPQRALGDLEVAPAVAAEQQQRREARRAALSDLPAASRDSLADLAPEGIALLRGLQARGDAPTPAERAQLLAGALRNDPDLDQAAFLRSLDEAVDPRTTQVEVSAGDQARYRQELRASVDLAVREQLDDVEIVVMRAETFDAVMRSRTGEAVTLVVDGRPRVVLREGADPTVLREEGIHAVQIRETGRIGERARTLDERTVARWDELDIDDQVSLYRSKVEVELDAQDRLIRSLEAELAGGPADPVLRRRLDASRRSRDNLRSRLREVEALGPLRRFAIAMGLASRPDYLAQPARLFAKDEGSLPDLLRTALDKLKRWRARVANEQHQQLLEDLSTYRLLVASLDSPAILRLPVEAAQARAQLTELRARILETAQALDQLGAFRNSAADLVRDMERLEPVVIAGRGPVRVSQTIDGLNAEQIRTVGPQQTLFLPSTAAQRQPLEGINGRVVVVVQDNSSGNVHMVRVLDAAEVNGALAGLQDGRSFAVTVQRLDGEVPEDFEGRLASDLRADNVAELVARDSVELDPTMFDIQDGRFVRGEDAPFEHVASLLNQQLDPVTADRLEQLIADFSEKGLGDEALATLALASGFGSMESLNTLYTAILATGRRKVYSPGGSTLGDNLAYLDRKGVFDTEAEMAARPEGREHGKLLPTRTVEERMVVVLDRQITEDTDLLVEMIQKNCKFIHPRGFERGLHLFGPEPIEGRVSDLIARAKEHQLEGEDYATALLRVLDADLEKAQRAISLEPTESGTNLTLEVEVVGPKPATHLTTDDMARHLSGFAGVTPRQLRAATMGPARATFPGKPGLQLRSTQLLLRLIADSAQVLSARTLGGMVREASEAVQVMANEEHGMFIHRRLRSYGMIALVHRMVTDSDPSIYFRHMTRALSDQLASVVIMDDVAGSGTSLREALTGSNDVAQNPGLLSGLKEANRQRTGPGDSTVEIGVPFEGQVLLAPLFRSSDARAKVAEMERPTVRFVEDAVEQITNVDNSEFVTGLSPDERTILNAVLSRYGRGFADNGLLLSFPYMSPNNDLVLFTRFLARYYIMNRSQNAAKEYVPE